MVTVLCMGCQKPVDMDDPIVHPPQNHTSFSQLTIEHPSRRVCPHCNVEVVIAVLRVLQVQMVAAPVPAQQQNRIILPGGRG